MKVKYYEGDSVEDLGLTMTVSENFFGVHQEVPLLTNGADIAVTNENKMIYIMHYTNYMLNLRTQMQVKSFVKGLRHVIQQDWLSYFYPDEIQLLISGGLNEISIPDLRANTKYNGWK